MKTYVYIDGFNLYYGALKGTRHKWLDVQALSQLLLPPHAVIERIKFFSAKVAGFPDPDAPRKQQIYFSALKSIPHLQMYFGSFLKKNKWYPITNLPVANSTIGTNPIIRIPAGTFTVTGSRQTQNLRIGNYATPQPGAKKRKRKPLKPPANPVFVEVFCYEEKGSDVNLASHLLNDAWRGKYDAALVISNDSDLVEPIRMVTTNRNLPVTVACPSRWPMTPNLRNVASFKRQIHPGMLKRCQFPQTIPGTTITKPTSWN